MNESERDAGIIAKWQADHANQRHLAKHDQMAREERGAVKAAALITRALVSTSKLIKEQPMTLHYHFTFNEQVPDKFKHATISDHFKKHVQQWKDHADTVGLPRIITLNGGTGVGKTHDACAWLNRAQAKGYATAYTKGSQYHEYDTEDLRNLRKIKCLVIDDYGTKQSEGNLSRIFDVVDARLEKAYTFTILTTNIVSQIREIDPRLASRLNVGLVIDYTGLPDRRINP